MYPWKQNLTYKVYTFLFIKVNTVEPKKKKVTKLQISNHPENIAIFKEYSYGKTVKNQVIF